jgi:hypothetical protein
MKRLEVHTDSCIYQRSFHWQCMWDPIQKVLEIEVHNEVNKKMTWNTPPTSTCQQNLYINIQEKLYEAI